jgi:hypothetical protein
MSRKIQTLTIKKESSNWTDAYSALSELREDIERCSAYQNGILYESDEVERTVELNIETQTITEVKTWSTDTYNSHRSLVGDYEASIQSELEGIGWYISDSTIDG